MKILVVVDMQKDFIDGVLGTPEAQKIVPNVEKKIKEAIGDGQMVAFTVDTHYSNYMDTEEGKNLPVPHCIMGTDGINLAPGIDKLARDAMQAGKRAAFFRKETFGSIGMADLFKSNDTIEEVELVGLCTDICVISNAMVMKAALPNAHIVVDAACCAGVTPESHDTAIAAMKACQVEVINQGNEPWRK